MNLSNLWTFIKARFSEPSSALGAIQIITAIVGINLPDTQQKAIAAAVVAIVGLVAVFLPDKKA